MTLRTQTSLNSRMTRLPSRPGRLTTQNVPIRLLTRSIRTGKTMPFTKRFVGILTKHGLNFCEPTSRPYTGRMCQVVTSTNLCQQRRDRFSVISCKMICEHVFECDYFLSVGACSISSGYRNNKNTRWPRNGSRILCHFGKLQGYQLA